MRRCVWLSAAALVLLQTCAWAQLLVPTVVDTFYLPLGRVPAFRSNVTTAAAVAVEQLGKALTPAWLTDAKERLAKRGIVFPSVTRVAVTPVWRLSLLVSTIPLPTSPAEAANWLQEPALGVTQALFSPYSIDWRLQFLYGADYQAGLVNPAVVNTAGGVVAVPRGSVGRRRHRRRRRALHQQPNDDERIVAQLLAQCLEEAPDVYRGRSLTSPAHPQQGRRHLAQASGAFRSGRRSDAALPAGHQHRHIRVEAATCRGAFHFQHQRQPHGNFLRYPRRTLARCGEKQPSEREPSRYRGLLQSPRSSALWPQGHATLRSHWRRLGKTWPAYRCERHAHCSARPQRRPSAGDEQHGGVCTGACAASRELGPHSAVIYELSCIKLFCLNSANSVEFQAAVFPIFWEQDKCVPGARFITAFR